MNMQERKVVVIGAGFVGGFTGGALEGTNTYREVLRLGGTEAEAARAAEIMTLASAGLNALSLNTMLGKSDGVLGKFKHFFISALIAFIRFHSRIGLLAI